MVEAMTVQFALHKAKSKGLGITKVVWTGYLSDKTLEWECETILEEAKAWKYKGKRRSTNTMAHELGQRTKVSINSYHLYHTHYSNVDIN